MPMIETLEGPLAQADTLKAMAGLGMAIGAVYRYYAWQLISEKTIWMFVWDAPRQMADIGTRMAPPTGATCRSCGGLCGIR